MDIKSVRKYVAPGYPDRPEVNDEPELLLALPERWKVNPVVMAAVASTIILGSTWQAAAAEESGPPDSARVAPVFQHGDGMGGYGCVAINPPVFLSEDEARHVIVDEAKRAGLDFKPDSRTLSKVSMLYSYHLKWTKATDRDKGILPIGYKTEPRDLKLDGTDAKRNVSFEYVSEEDVSKWSEGSSSTWTTIDTQTHARVLAKGLSKSGAKGYYAVFYDPEMLPKKAVYTKDEKEFSKRYDAAQAAGKASSKEELRKQVRDFVQWLKAEGVI